MMFPKIRKFFRQWSVISKLEQYENLLGNLDGGNCKPTEYPVILKEFWRVFDMSLLENVTIRDVMGHLVTLRHRSFGELHELFLSANDAIANEKDSLLDYITRTQMGQQAEVDMENYFHAHMQGYLSVKDCFIELRLLLIAHCGILENIEDTYAQRKMLHVYYDIMQLTEEALDIIAKKEFND